jgi:hypothetical protein
MTNIQSTREWLRHTQWAIIVIALFSMLFWGIVDERFTYGLILKVSIFGTICLGLQWICTFGFFHEDGTCKQQDPFLWILFGFLTFLLLMVAGFSVPVLFKETKSINQWHFLLFAVPAWASLLGNTVLIARFILGSTRFGPGHHPEHQPIWPS